MGFLDNDNTGIGNTSKPTTPSVSGVSAVDMDIYNYNKITVHYSTGVNPGTVQNITLEQQGCYYNGQPAWTYEDGTYDGDYEVPTGELPYFYNDSRFGGGVCQGKSHQLRFGGGGSTGQWEFMTHGYITSWTTASTLNFFNIQGSGDTAGQAGPGMGGWISATGTTDNSPYGRFRIDTSTHNAGGLTGVTTDGIIN